MHLKYAAAFIIFLYVIVLGTLCSVQLDNIDHFLSHRDYFFIKQVSVKSHFLHSVYSIHNDNF